MGQELASVSQLYCSISSDKMQPDVGSVWTVRALPRTTGELTPKYISKKTLSLLISPARAGQQVHSDPLQSLLLTMAQTPRC